VATVKMPRLSALLDAPAGDVQVKLAFARDEQGIATLHGHYQAEVALICQRCLEQVVVPLDSQCDVGFVEVTRQRNICRSTTNRLLWMMNPWICTR